jgi:hypothetical protein
MAARIQKPKPARKIASTSASKSSGKAPAKTAAKSKKAAAKPAPKAKATPKANAKGALKVRVKPALKAKPKAAPKPAGRGAPAPAKKATKSNTARDALKALAMKKAIAEVITPVESGSAVVDAYMRDVDHPFKAEMEAVRNIILGASPKIAERIKWNAPSFYYKEDLGAFHPRATEYAHLILLFPGGTGIPAKSALLEGKQKDRREAKFLSLADIESKRPALEKLVRAWVALRDA